MKKSFLSFTLVLIVTSLFISCKKEKNEPEPQGENITFTIDGVKKVFKVNDTAKVYISDVASMVMMNANADSVSPESISFRIIVGEAITVGTYATGPVDISVSGLYTPGTSGTRLISGNEPNEGMKITFTSLTDEKATGTFSGIFYEENGDQSKKVTITGSFNVPVSNYQN